ncbi:hypothetical protein GO308_11280 [Sphingomonas sp. SFZ2018-12]|uniref:glycoside hydrolase family 113 n=1 Tax=Sphingomonas sp. SFZ2018-12 TaxID=2683197 RepID=UPI000A4519E9|nr:hypothetical protein [Sphingomonas sp. SFZ2018-12]MCH4893693.1 hypothetical protein [Sphingomonas sp. SFZ2018-12]
MNRRDILTGAMALPVVPGIIAGTARAAPGDDHGLFFHGMNYGYLAKQGYFRAKGAADVDAMADIGVKWVSLIVMLMQDTIGSLRMYRDFTYTADDLELAAVIDRFHKRGIKVLLKPLLDIQDSSWRGRINFPPLDDQQILGRTNNYWPTWFASMNEAMLYYARMATMLDVEAFAVGAELVGTYPQTDLWRQTVAKVRDVYRGPLCVAAHQDSMKDPAVQAWMREVDYVGLSFYPDLPEPESPTPDDVVRVLSPLRAQYREIATAIGKPLFWSEAGIRSVKGGMKSTGQYRNAAPYDGMVQANYLEGMFRTFWNEPWWAGCQLWKWDEQQQRPHYAQPGGDTGFTVQGKPAEAVIRRWSTVGRAR